MAYGGWNGMAHNEWNDMKRRSAVSFWLVGCFMRAFSNSKRAYDDFV